MIIENIAGVLIILLLFIILIEYRRRVTGEVQVPSSDISIYNGVFWDLWIQKILRNFASMKYQILLLLYSVIVYGMFWAPPDRMISTTLGIGFLGGGFVTMATSRIIANTSLFENKSGADDMRSVKKGEVLDTDK